MMYEDDGWMWGHSWGAGSWIVLGVVTILLVTALVTVLVLAVRYLSSSQQAPAQPAVSTQDHSDRLLADRFARGEIDEDEFRRRIAVLREHR